MVINVEYNQLDPLLRATGHSDGDVNDPETGFSPYPGNINQVFFFHCNYFFLLTLINKIFRCFIYSWVMQEKKILW